MQRWQSNSDREILQLQTCVGPLEVRSCHCDISISADSSCVQPRSHYYRKGAGEWQFCFLACRLTRVGNLNARMARGMLRIQTNYHCGFPLAEIRSKHVLARNYHKSHGVPKDWVRIPTNSALGPGYTKRSPDIRKKRCICKAG